MKSGWYVYTLMPRDCNGTILRGCEFRPDTSPEKRRTEWAALRREENCGNFKLVALAVLDNDRSVAETHRLAGWLQDAAIDGAVEMRALLRAGAKQ